MRLAPEEIRESVEYSLSQAVTRGSFTYVPLYLKKFGPEEFVDSFTAEELPNQTELLLSVLSAFEERHSELEIRNWNFLELKDGRSSWHLKCPSLWISHQPRKTAHRALRPRQQTRLYAQIH